MLSQRTDDGNLAGDRQTGDVPSYERCAPTRHAGQPDGDRAGRVGSIGGAACLHSQSEVGAGRPRREGRAGRAQLSRLADHGVARAECGVRAAERVARVLAVLGTDREVVGRPGLESVNRLGHRLDFVGDEVDRPVSESSLCGPPWGRTRCTSCPARPVVESTLPFSVALVSVMSVAGWRTPTAQLDTTTPTTIADRASTRRFTELQTVWAEPAGSIAGVLRGLPPPPTGVKANEGAGAVTTPPRPSSP